VRARLLKMERMLTPCKLGDGASLLWTAAHLDAPKQEDENPTDGHLLDEDDYVPGTGDDDDFGKGCRSRTLKRGKTSETQLAVLLQQFGAHFFSYPLPRARRPPARNARPNTPLVPHGWGGHGVVFPCCVQRAERGWRTMRAQPSPARSPRVPPEARTRALPLTPPSPHPPPPVLPSSQRRTRSPPWRSGRPSPSSSE
jgi:hypothetical protein